MPLAQSHLHMAGTTLCWKSRLVSVCHSSCHCLATKQPNRCNYYVCMCFNSHVFVLAVLPGVRAPGVCIKKASKQPCDCMHAHAPLALQHVPVSMLLCLFRSQHFPTSSCLVCTFTSLHLPKIYNIIQISHKYYHNITSYVTLYQCCTAECKRWASTSMTRT